MYILCESKKKMNKIVDEVGTKLQVITALSPKRRFNRYYISKTRDTFGDISSIIYTVDRLLFTVDIA